MSGVEVLFLILLYHTSLLHNGEALVVFAPTPQRAELGEDFVLPCSFKVDKAPINPQFLAILWFFRDREVLRFDNKGTSPHSRLFINAQDTSKGIANMEIRNVTISDIGKYRCMIVYSPLKDFKEIELSVYATPSIIIDSVEKEDKTRIAQCSVTGFYPRDIRLQILKDGTTIEDSVLSQFHTNADGTYSVNRTWEIPPELSPKLLSCLVHHETFTPVRKDLQLAYAGQNDEKTNVGVIVGCVIGALILVGVIAAVFYFKRRAGSQKFGMSDIESPVWIDGEKTTLSCKAFNCSRDVRVIWIIQAKNGTKLEVTENPSTDKEEEEPLMSREYGVTKEMIGENVVSTKLTFIPSRSRHMETTMTCRICDDKITMEKPYMSTSICVKPEFIKPIKSTLSHQGDVELSASLHKFYPKKMQINWFSIGGKSQEIIKSEETSTNNNDNTFNLESKCKVSGELFKDPACKVMVKWTHESMDGEQSQELSVRDLPWCPKQQNISIESEVQGDEVLLKCSVSDYFPDALTVKWFEKIKDSQDLVEASSSEKYKISKLSSSRKENGTFSSRANLSYRRSDLPEKGIIFICRVEHPGLGTPIECNSFQYRDAVTTAAMPTFSINNIYGPHTWYHGEKVTLYCGALYCTEDPRVIWNVMEANGTSYDVLETTSGGDVKSGGLHHHGYLAHRERTDVSNKEGLLDVTSSLTFTPSISKHINITIACKIVDSDGKFKEKTFQNKNIFAKPTVSSPIKLSLTDSGEVLCSLDIEKFYPSGIQIKWNEKETSDHGNISPNNDRTYTVHSDYKLSGSFFSHPDSAVMVSWKHASMADWETRQISVLDKEFPWKPEVRDIPVPNLFNGNTATLKCEVSNVFPNALSVRWLKKEKNSEEIFPLIHNDTYNISELRPEKQKDNTFKYKSCLKFTPSINTDGGAEFICRVEHPALKEPAEKSTGPLTIEDKKKFIVGEIKGPCRWIHGESVTLYCPVSYCSKDTQVTWMVEHTDGRVEEISNNGEDSNPDSVYVISKEADEPDKDGLSNTTSLLTFVPSVSKHMGVTIACSVSFDGQTKTKKFQPESIYAKPQAPEAVKASLCDGGDVLCSLNFQNLYPNDVKLTWRSGEDQLTSREEYEKNNDGTFNGRSHCTVPGNLLLNPNFILRVTWSHKSLDGEQSQVLSWRDPGLSWRPAIEKVPIPHILMIQRNTFQYNISRYFPDAVTVSWYKKEKGAREFILLQDDKDYEIPDIQSQRQSDLTYSCTAKLIFNPAAKDDESEIMCRVSHPSLEGPTEIGSGPLHVQSKPKIRKPIKPTLGTREIMFSQILENIYPKDIQLEWHYWSAEKLEQRCPSEEKYKNNLDKTITIESKCKVSEDLLNSSDFRVRLTWRHESMDEEEFRELSIRDGDFPWKPKVEVSAPPLRIGEEATIQCTVTKYFPDAVTVMWFRKDERSGEMYPVTSDEEYEITNIPLDRRNEKTYGCTSRVTFLPSLERDQGVEYVCRVQHPSLGQPIEESTGALQVTEPEPQNQLPSHEDTGEVHQYSNSQNTMERMESDQEMISYQEGASLESFGATYAKNAKDPNKAKPPSKQYGPLHAFQFPKSQEKKQNSESKKHASDRTLLKLQQSPHSSSDP